MGGVGQRTHLHEGGVKVVPVLVGTGGSLALVAGHGRTKLLVQLANEPLEGDHTSAHKHEGTHSRERLRGRHSKQTTRAQYIAPPHIPQSNKRQ